MSKELKQSTQQVLMVRPKRFGFNIETAANNHFQNSVDTRSKEEISHVAITEFDNAVQILNKAGVDVIVVEDTDTPVKTDAVFPNNWFSTHQNGTLLTYPMCAENRRPERRDDVIKMLMEHKEYRHLHFEDYENQQQYLESTGSMVLDRVNKKSYACLSDRTHPSLLDKFCVLMGYENIMFRASDEENRPIYHTNVMMALGTRWAIVCTDSIKNPEENTRVQESLHRTGKDIIDINFDQMGHFLGNAIELRTNGGETICAMSETAYNAISDQQRSTLEQYVRILPISIPTIETAGGGSIRCMIAEIF